MILVIECMIACVTFTLIVLPRQYKDPIKYIMSYPPPIRQRVESLPQYKNMIQEKEKRHIIVKITALLLITIILSFVAYFSGANSFSSAYYHVFVLVFAINIYDVIVLDIGLFCHIKKLRIPGTEDMDKEYRSPWFHVVGGVKGTLICVVIASLSGFIVYMISLISLPK
jgi:uncharacterized membrane protein